MCHTGELFPSGEAGRRAFRGRRYRITRQGRAQLAAWFSQPSADGTPPRDELVLKLILAAARGPEQLQRVIRSERKAAVETLQEYTRLKRDPVDAADLAGCCCSTR